MQEGEGDDRDDTDPNSTLVSSHCVTYCDLKTNTTVYWFAFPALTTRAGRGIAYSRDDDGDDDADCGDATAETTAATTTRPQRRVVDAWGARGCRSLSTAFHALRVREEARRRRATSDDQEFLYCIPILTAGGERGRKRKLTSEVQH